MAVSSLKYLSQIVLGSGTTIYELDDATPQNAVDELIGMAAGYPEPLFRGVKRQKPSVKFGTVQVADMLTAVNAGGAAPFAADVSAGNTDLWYADATNLASRTAAASLAHQRFRMTKACLYWERLTARAQEDAKIDAVLKPIYDGSNNPLQSIGSLALPGTPIGSQRYTMGPIKINNVMLAGVQEWSLSSGVKENEENSDGDLYDTWASLDTTNPVLEITGRTIDWWNTYGPATPITSVVMFLLQKSATGNWPFVNTPSKHISITGTAGTVMPDSASGRKSQTKLKIGFAAPAAGTSSLAVALGVNVA